MDQPDYSDTPYGEHLWIKSTYGNVEEVITNDAPEPFGNYVTTTHYVDANLLHDLMTGGLVFKENNDGGDGYLWIGDDSTFGKETHWIWWIATTAFFLSMKRGVTRFIPRQIRVPIAPHLQLELLEFP